MSSKEMSRKNMNLFGDDDEDDVLGDAEPEEFDLNLDEKLNRSERKTSKLIELQSKFAHDSRFKIDEQFLDDDDEEDQAPKTEIEEEKSKNIAILEQVLGKKIHHTKPIDPVSEYRKVSQDKRHSVKNAASSTVYNTVLTPRFDPTKAESKIYEIEEEPTKKRKVNIDFDELDRRDELEAKKKAKKEPVAVATTTTTTAKKAADPKAKEPASSSSTKKEAKPVENYYEVNVNLKDTLASTEDFSLGSFLGLSSFEEPAKLASEANENASYEPISALERKKLKQLRNPFKYDSSDDEDETGTRTKWNDQEEEEEEGYDEEAGADEETEDKVEIKVTPPTPQLLSAFGGFFFRLDDPRLKQDQFYTPELVEKIRANGKERSLEMMRALSFRKRAAMKNVKSNEKYIKKLKMLRQMKRGKKGGRRSFRRNPRFNDKRNNNRQINRNKSISSGNNKPTAKPVATTSA